MALQWCTCGMRQRSEDPLKSHLVLTSYLQIDPQELIIFSSGGLKQKSHISHKVDKDGWYMYKCIDNFFLVWGHTFLPVISKEMWKKNLSAAKTGKSLVQFMKQEEFLDYKSVTKKMKVNFTDILIPDIPLGSAMEVVLNTILKLLKWTLQEHPDEIWCHYILWENASN